MGESLTTELDHVMVEGDICDSDTVAAVVTGIDTIFHTAALIEPSGPISE